MSNKNYIILQEYDLHVYEEKIIQISLEKKFKNIEFYIPDDDLSNYLN